MDPFELGKSAARRDCAQRRRGGRLLAAEILDAVRRIERERYKLERVKQTKPPSAVEWFLDNAYLAKREGLLAAESLRECKTLRWVGREIYLQRLAQGFVLGQPEPSLSSLSDYLEGVQSVAPLLEEELAFFIPALKGALCCRLADLCGRLEEEPEGEGLAGSVESVMTWLRCLATENLGPILEAASRVERILRQDPSGAYGRMDEATRARYRRQVCLLAQKGKLSQTDTAERALELSRKAEGEERHIGWFLFRRPLGKQERRDSDALYLSAVLLPALTLALWLSFRLGNVALSLLLVLPASDLSKNLVDFMATRLVRPRSVPRMELKEGVPPEGRTLCVIAGLLTGERSGTEYGRLLERYRLANRDCGEELRFGLLADLPDRDAPMGTEQRCWVSEAQRAIDALNQKYRGGFYLFFREPVFQPADERYTGWERKRGALLELTRLLRGRPSTLRALSGDGRALAKTRYVITLDSDTALDVGTARELIGAMLHPLNRPRIDVEKRVVTGGYGLLQPRIGVALHAANKTRFSRIVAGVGGIDPYGGACSDVYHDLFDRGTYTGKGIFDVDAFSRCLDGRFPQNRILSHDLLEGAYLHAGLLEDVELTDGCPGRVTGYYSRLHRWVRGDWQLLPWLGRRVKTESGEVVENPISSMDKWKLFDNLRRSLSPVFTLVAILLGMCLSAPAFGTAGALAVVAAWSNLLLTGADLAVHGGTGAHRRYHAAIVAGVGGMALQTLVQLLFLPYHAWVCGSAIITALWRSLVSHRKLLEWVTAADSERGKCGIAANYRAQWPAVAVGLFAMAFASLPAGTAVGLVWTAAPLFAWAFSRPVEEETGCSEEDRPFLLHQAGMIWNYFRDWLRSEDYWLPPDNVQERPWLGPARRTSPTNVGMALLTCISAADLELIGRQQAIELISHILETVSALPKWRGHLYNWYDTSDITPLRPRYVSTVDSGNLRGCLIALREALLEWGEDKLAGQAEDLLRSMDLSPLYDWERKLFAIGYDVEKGTFSPGWYDLMGSEARLTSYLAVALGEVPPRHWRHLSRALVGVNDWCGMASWTGTMFEYFMPNLLLPCEPGSLAYESLSFCVYAQKRRGAKAKAPWGISESGFYALDPGMAYQYKAHGVQALGLKRDLDGELVVAPYASFLALLLAPKSACKNLRRLRDMGLEGKYGLYEAADFTPARIPAGEQWAVIGSFMAHHLGMSMVAIDNALRDNIMQRRFMRDRSMGAYRELLQEKVPVGAPVMRPDRVEGPERIRPERRQPFYRTGSGYDLARPSCHLLSNGLMTALCTDAGAVGLTDDRGETPVLTIDRERYSPAGVSFFYREPKGKLWPLTAEPMLDAPSEQTGWSFDGTSATWTATFSAASSSVRLILPGEERGALWTVSLEGAEGGELICYLEPVLAREADYRAHPAYSKLSLDRFDLDRGVGFVRRPRTGERRAALAVLWDRERADWDGSREGALGRGGLRRLEQALERPASGEKSGVLDPCLLVRFPLTGRGPHGLRLALASEDGEETAERTARRILSAPDRASDRLDGMLRSLRLSREEAGRVMELLSVLAFPARKERRVPQSALWAHGVSGDLPITVVDAGDEKEQTNRFPILAHALLGRCGFPFDLVYLVRDGGDYQRPRRTRVLETIKAAGCESMMGKKGGIHLAEPPGEGETSPWEEWAAVWMDAAGRWSSEGTAPIQPPALPCRLEKTQSVNWSYTPEVAVRLVLKGALPPLAWSHLLVNPRFGWLTDETGRGHLWEGNAREGQLTPWDNDPLSIGGPEWFRLTWQGETHSLFADGDALSVMVTYGLGWARWEKVWPMGKVTTTALVPWSEDRRLLSIHLSSGAGELLHVSKWEGEKLYNFDGEICLSTSRDGTSVVEQDGLDSLFEETVSQWDRLCRPLQITTPDEVLNHYMNGWCLYQIIACRLLARTSQYQNGGAYGFRDQLQDTLALLPFDPAWTKEQLLRCCAHQFQEGDVLHWWHEERDGSCRGVRTRISDDLLWLPYALERYVETWGDKELLAVRVSYLAGEPLKKQERERYFRTEVSQETEGVYAHALRAIRCALDRGTGDHGLLKMGTGDWNDGMNEVGQKGTGESVWLTWFAVKVLEDFIPLSEELGDREATDLCKEWATSLRRAAEGAWDGEWYLRGWYDDGTPLGSRRSEACQIDSIPQSWAVLAGADREKRETALRSALERLYDRQTGVIKLLDPPFDRGAERPGYIRGYLPGIRENGGQYTHAAVWLALACFTEVWTKEGLDLLKSLLPEYHGQESYRAEPYVLAGDVYAHPRHPGRGGWSWYTGAAGWFCQTVVQGLLGIAVKGGNLMVRPALPKGWDGWSARWKTPKGSLAISVRRGDREDTRLDGAIVEAVPLKELRGEHLLEITVLP